ncbi:D-alanyl-D-alanine carboxypeptidase/D-alanyl-D-alanine-endopeptidase [Jeongeupia naejangsanensis]|uniref:D-alanyl-D-alanine carboxypeptidase/D-alanyl-D-alanine-endopeptidase n=1 Tax=Jeongeupia naejangsanensis TaxID=613195 RepID=A0ABS2BHR6_9NEIS|nr:D-alanyl-D-alanine carboxypeptidase/D-alanyl-D-alanine-endopeptidase [Jeongeupia naejangsanensis]MBM3115153.1 D-alanyl-D-alanine carboxypeptidase/D-alanyl-D-alanine-endopeptidase [Jeongeupia naejangsanensis]
MKRLLFSLLLFSGAAHAALPAEVDAALLKAGVPASALGVAILPVDGGPAVLLENAGRPMNPASTMKLVTTWSALNLLGPAYSWKTQLLADAPVVNGVLGGPLYLKGSGDPKLTFERMWLLVRELRAAGVTDLRGDLVLDRSAFKLPATTSPFDDDSDEGGQPYLVTPDALVSNFGSARLMLRSDGNAVRATLEPALAAVKLDSTVKLAPNASCAAWKDGVQLRLDDAGQSASVQVAGRFPPDCAGDRYFAVLDARSYTASLFRSLWQEQGGRFTGQVRDGTTPVQAKVLATSVSPPLTEMVRDINKFSNNLMARQLFLTLGATAPDPATDTIAAADFRVRDWLRQQGLAMSELHLENGAGLSRVERISAEHLGQMLVSAYRSPLAPEFISSLPIVGIDGTMRKRLKNEAGAAHIKTGTLKNVRAVAGYVRDAQGHDWAVVALVNHPKAPGAMPVLDSLLRWVTTRSTAELASLRN